VVVMKSQETFGIYAIRLPACPSFGIFYEEHSPKKCPMEETRVRSVWSAMVRVVTKPLAYKVGLLASELLEHSGMVLKSLYQ